MKGNAEKSKEKLNYALKEDNYAKLDQKEEKDQVVDSQERMYKIILKLAFLKSSTRLNMKKLREKDDEVLNDANYIVTTEAIEELDKLNKTLEEKCTSFG